MSIAQLYLYVNGGIMDYKEIAISERTERIKRKYLELPVAKEANPYVDKKYKSFRSGDRWITLGYLRGWYDHADAETTLLRTSYAEAEELYFAKPVIYDDELLVGHLYLPEYTPDEQAEYERLADMFVMSSHTLIMRGPRKDHIALNFEKLLRLGISGVKREIEEKMNALDLDDVEFYPEYSELRKYEFYKCMLIELDAVLDLAERYAIYARELASGASEPRRSELEKIAEIMERVPKYPARSFWEAVQSVQFFLGGLFGLYPLGRPDRYLYPYYKKDIESGAIDREFAQELIDNMCLYISDRVFTRAACGFIVGGSDARGGVVENDLTYMFLTALGHIKLPDPNGALAVNEKTSDGILRYAAKILSEGTTHPAFYNDREIVKSLINNYGVRVEDAVEYIHSTCAEISVAGKSKSHSTPIELDMPRLLHETVREKPTLKSTDELIELYIARVQKAMRQKMLYYGMRMLEGVRIGNEQMRICALVDDCIERGKSIYDGGERYTFIQPIFVGFATALDSILAIESIVFEGEKLSLSEFSDIVENNFENNELLRKYIINRLEHYGNDTPRADELAKTLGAGIVKICRTDKVLGGRLMCPGTFSYINHATIGSKMGATYDGRLSGSSYSDGCCPVQGRDVGGPTAMILSLSSWDQSEMLGGMVVNIKFSREHLCGDGADKFISLLRTFVARGGIEMQVNAVDRKTLEAARREPEKYGNLMVRIGGFSDYFVRLTPVLQQEIIDRTEY